MGSNTVELNGKRYDAVTGVFLGDNKHTSRLKSIGILKGHHQGRNIDGIARKSSSTASPAPKLSTPAKAISNLGASAKNRLRSMDGFAHSMNNLVPHQPARSLTLKRTAVKPPGLTMKPAIKKQLPAEKHVSVMHPVTPKPSISRVNPDRLAHASKVPRSQHVKHFGPHRAQAPQPVPAPRATATFRRQPAVPVPRVEESEEDMFELAITQATSHEQKAPKRRLSAKRKLANIGAIAVGLVVVGIFVAYLNLPTIEVNLASERAGFNATMPDYKALGFSLQNPIKTTGGTVAMNFTSGDSQFTLTQEASDWDNQTLLDSLATQSDSMPKAIQSDGHTIYMMNTNQATWVNGGIRYDLTGNANLNSQEITAVADSL